MFKYCDERKVLRDPVHGYIHVDYQVVWDCINSPEFQRLRRIHQFGVTYQVYHSGEHSRFGHSLGVYEIARRMMAEVKGLDELLSEDEKVATLLAALLHDLGHGPFSHAFESITKISHEVFTDRYLLENTAVHRILENAEPGLSRTVSDIVAHRHSNPLLTQIVSSQIDADRMDYLLRDSYCSGVRYGEFDLERILRTLRIRDQKLVIKESGVNAVEDYIMARYHMYWQVYYHPTGLSIETMIKKFFQRMRDCYKKGELDLFEKTPFFLPFLSGKDIALQAHFDLDENTCMYGVSVMILSEDPILKDLAYRILNRVPFKYASITSDEEIEVKQHQLREEGYDLRYYFDVTTTEQRPYNPYQNDSSSLIYVLMEDGSLVELSLNSVIVGAIVKGQSKEVHKMFFPAGRSHS